MQGWKVQEVFCIKILEPRVSPFVLQQPLGRVLGIPGHYISWFVPILRKHLNRGVGGRSYLVWFSGGCLLSQQLRTKGANVRKYSTRSQPYCSTTLLCKATNSKHSNLAVCCLDICNMRCFTLTLMHTTHQILLGSVLSRILQNCGSMMCHKSEPRLPKDLTLKIWHVAKYCCYQL